MFASTLEMSGAMAASLAPTVTMHDIELCTTGTHAGSTGPTPVSRADFESMLRAATDPEVDRAPAHPGHYDPRFVQAYADGEPALGYVRPTRIVDYADGTSKLVGDLVDVPSKMAAIIPKAFARRSIEFGPKVTPSGRAYGAALTGLGLLGVAIPAVKGLADIVNRYAAQPIATVAPAVWIDDTPTGVQSLAAAWFTAGDDVARAQGIPTEGGVMPHLDQARYAALVQAEQLRHAQALAGALSASAVADPVAPALPGYPGMPDPTLAPAVAQQQLMPGWPAPVGAAPAPVAAPLVPLAPQYTAPAAPQAPAGYAFDAAGQIVPAVTPPLAAPAVPTAALPQPQFTAPPAAAPQVGYVMGPNGQPVAVQLPPATVQQFTAPAPVQLPAAPIQQFAAAPAPVQAPQQFAPAAQMPAIATMSAGQVEELQQRAQRGDQAMAALEAQQREHYLTAAVTQGRIALTERPHWALSLQRDPAGTLQLLNALTPGRVPVAPVGQAVTLSAPGGGGVDDAAWDAWEHDTFGTGSPPQPAAQPFYGYAPAPAVPMGV